MWVFTVYMCLVCVYMKKQLEQCQQTSCKRPDGKWLCRACSLCPYSSILLLKHESSHQKQHINEWVWCAPIKLYLYKQALARMWPMSHNLPTTGLDYKLLIWEETFNFVSTVLGKEEGKGCRICLIPIFSHPWGTSGFSIP